MENDEARDEAVTEGSPPSDEEQSQDIEIIDDSQEGGGEPPSEEGSQPGESETETPDVAKLQEQINNLNQGISGLRDQLKLTKEQNDFLQNQLQAQQVNRKTEDEEPLYEDPNGFLNAQGTEKVARTVAERAMESRIRNLNTTIGNLAEMTVRALNPDYDEVVGEMFDEVKRNPVYMAHVRGAGDPEGVPMRLYQTCKQLKAQKAQAQVDTTTKQNQAASIVNQINTPRTAGARSKPTKKDTVTTSEVANMSLEQLAELRKKGQLGKLIDKSFQGE